MTFALLTLLAACGPDADPKPPGGEPDPTADTAPPADTDASIVPLELQVAIAAVDPLAVELTVTLDRAATVSVTCTSPDDPEEELAATFEHPKAPLRMHGLLADTRYTCAVDAIDGAATASWTGDVISGSIPEGFPAWTTAPGADAAGYVLFNTVTLAPKVPNEPRWILVDPEGRIRWYRELLAPDESRTNIGVELAWVPEREAILACGGDGIEPAFYDLDGGITPIALPTDDLTSFHHDCQLLPDGSVLGLRNARAFVSGVEVPGTDVVIVRPDGTESWRWSLQTAVDAGVVTSYTPEQLRNVGDPWHANAVAYLEDDGEGSAIWLSLKADNRLLRIAYPAGDVTRWVGVGGPERMEDAKGKEVPDGSWFYSQHGVDYRLEADGLHIFLYDNGSGRPGPNGSRALEIVDAGGFWREVHDFDDGGSTWYTPLWGDVDWLSDGRDLIAKPHCWDCVAVPVEQRTEILVHDRTRAREDWRLNFALDTDTLYRAQWIHGCDIFGNRRYCK